MRRLDPTRIQTPAEHQRHYRERQIAGPDVVAFRTKRVDEARAYRYMKLYGITVAQYDAMMLAQGGVCAACGGTSKTRLHVDHDHETGEVRGLLCISCNVALGFLESELRPLWEAYLSRRSLEEAI